ncbi:hypothetical protein [Limnohabitans sp.]|jgi:hypothetical protein|uniref:hypothetical protein n=2 Tax=Limnohabitans sp. TaxID=1907725 RepID=UPI00286FA484|nr:hypothetical protein [Limnohabitans sp.]
MKMLTNLIPWMSALLVQRDKQQHVVCSFLIYLIAGVVVPVGVALVFTLFIGLLKEVWDKYFGTGFCYYDLLSNCIGVGLAIPVGYLINTSILL